jgi:hypothetical protein
MPPPLTKTKEEVIKGSLQPLEAEIQFLIEEGNIPFDKDLVSGSQVQSALECHGQRVSSQKIAGALKNFGSDLGPVRINGGSRPRLYAIRNVDFWKKASDQERGQHYMRHLSVPISLAS